MQTFLCFATRDARGGGVPSEPLPPPIGWLWGFALSYLADPREQLFAPSGGCFPCALAQPATPLRLVWPAAGFAWQVLKATPHRRGGPPPGRILMSCDIPASQHPIFQMSQGGSVEPTGAPGTVSSYLCWPTWLRHELRRTPPTASPPRAEPGQSPAHFGVQRHGDPGNSTYPAAIPAASVAAASLPAGPHGGAAGAEDLWRGKGAGREVPLCPRPPPPGEG